MESTEAVWNVLLWGLGICVSGFFVLLGMVIKTSKEVARPLQEIRDALLGTMSPRKPGLFSDFYSMKEEFERMQAECNRRHTIK
jgi:hypothetical protein